MPNEKIGFTPVTKGDFKSFWSLGSGWGGFARNEKEYKISLSYGSLTLKTVILGDEPKVKAVFADGNPIAFTQNGAEICFDSVTVKKELRFEV